MDKQFSVNLFIIIIFENNNNNYDNHNYNKYSKKWQAYFFALGQNDYIPLTIFKNIKA